MLDTARKAIVRRKHPVAGEHVPSFLAEAGAQEQRQLLPIGQDAGEVLWSRAFRLGSSGAEAPSSNRACRFPAYDFP